MGVVPEGILDYTHFLLFSGLLPVPGRAFPSNNGAYIHHYLYLLSSKYSLVVMEVYEQLLLHYYTAVSTKCVEFV